MFRVIKGFWDIVTGFVNLKLVGAIEMEKKREVYGYSIDTKILLMFY